MGCLLENDDGAVRLEGLLDLLRVFLGDTLFEYLWHRLDKFFGLDPTTTLSKERRNQRRVQKNFLRNRRCLGDRLCPIDQIGFRTLGPDREGLWI